MKLRIVSDIHLEVCNYELPRLDTDHETVLVLAGDICPIKNKSLLIPFLERASDHFQDIVYVMGNHEHWKGNITFSEKKLKEMFKDNEKIHILEDSFVKIDDVVFIGATLWTDFNKGDPLKLIDAPANMKDYQKIRWGKSYFKLRPDDIYAKHKASVKYIKDVANSAPLDCKLVLVTHHAPSPQSIHPRYATDTKYYGLYHSDLSQVLIDCGFDLAVHGHMHDSFDYMVDKCRVVCNPRGYVPIEPNVHFNPILTVEI